MFLRLVKLLVIKNKSILRNSELDILSLVIVLLFSLKLYSNRLLGSNNSSESSILLILGNFSILLDTKLLFRTLVIS